MAVDEIHVADTVTLSATITDGTSAVDISTATTKQLWLKPPNNGTLLQKDADFGDDGSDGIIQYTCATTDLDTAGDWLLQGYVVLSGGSEYHTDVYTFEVFPNLS